MLLALTAVVFGLVLLVWSADRFVSASATTAQYFSVPPLLIGMIIVGFGTSAPEMVVSAFAAWEGNAGIALGNAYGSNIVNIGLILGLTALIHPITVHSNVLRKELPILAAVTALTVILLIDLDLTRLDAFLLLLAFAVLMTWTVVVGWRQRSDTLATEVARDLPEEDQGIAKTLAWLLGSILLLIASSRLLVWGAVGLARSFGVNDMFIGLTIVSIGTSLPELASSIAAVRKREHDIALGNIIGSNLFNTLAVVGIAGTIHPISVEHITLTRDMVAMGGMTLLLYLFAYGFRGKQGCINRYEGAALLLAYTAYTVILLLPVLAS